MGDLISKSALIKVLSEKYSGLSDARDEYQFAKYNVFKEVLRVINKQPTNTTYKSGDVIYIDAKSDFCEYIFIAMCGDYCIAIPNYDHQFDFNKYLSEMELECKRWGNTNVNVFHKSRILEAKLWQN